MSSILNRYVYSASGISSYHRSSLIQVMELNERPLIVPPEVLARPLRPFSGSLAEMIYLLIELSNNLDQRVAFFHQCPCNHQQFGGQLDAHLGADPFFALATF
jgi:hypothetical protein